MNIGFIGIGKLGMPCAEAIARKGHSLNGYDVANYTSDHITIFSTIESTVKDANIVFVAVPTPHDPEYDGRAPTAHLLPKDFNYNIVKEVLIEANKHMTKDQLLVLISTVLPGTTRREFIPLITNTRFVYNPYLIAMGSVAWDMVNPEMVMIGTEDGNATGDAQQLIDFYKTIMENNPRYVVGTWDECECIKVFYNTFISTKIGLVNMIQDVAQKQGNINVDIVTQALAQSTQRIMGPQYMKAGMGDGGSCHPRDNIALRYMAQELGLGYDLFDAVMNAREQQARNMAIEIVKYGDRIQFSSDSYKSSVNYIDGSYSLLVQHYVKELGGIVVKENPLVYVLVHENDTVPDDVLVFDPWRTYTGKNQTVHYGNTRVKYES
jgi:UDPglucose 6-dehydrogenase